MRRKLRLQVFTTLNFMWKNVKFWVVSLAYALIWWKHLLFFCACDSLSSMCIKSVQTKECLCFPLVCTLIKLAMILLVLARPSIRSALSAMVAKTYLSNNVGREWLNDMTVCYIERDIFTRIVDQNIVE